MTLSINTSIESLVAHKNKIKHDNALSASLERLSSGKRINKAADDAAGMIMADTLRSQVLAFGQAIRNAHDALSLIQVIDASLEESINIVHTIKQKAIQAAQDGQTTKSRESIQSDITQLLEEMDTIAKTTSFNNQKLLSGGFNNKKIQIGASPGETVNLSIPAALPNKLGHTVNGRFSLKNEQAGIVQIGILSNVEHEYFRIQPVELRYDNSREHSLGALANVVNQLSGALGITAAPFVQASTTSGVSKGVTSMDFAINGIIIGQIQVQDNDSDGALVKAINKKTVEHGVQASTDNLGRLILNAPDSRAIQVTSNIGSGTGTDAVLRGADLSTFGYIQMRQKGPYDITVIDVNGGAAVALTTELETAGNVLTSSPSTIASGSTLAATSVLKKGWLASQDLVGTLFRANIFIEDATSMTIGSSLGAASVLRTNDTLGGDALVRTTTVTTGESTIKGGSTLATGSVLG
ncbi:MAG: flagellin hook IN motif-containing protein, partial [Candidatus Tectomicrobia bacterium]